MISSTKAVESYKFQEEPLPQVWDEVMALAKAHWHETEKYRHDQTFCPSLERYQAYVDAGWFFVFTARSMDKLIGYAGMYLVPSQHTQELIATEDTFFLEEQHRKGWTAFRFLKFIEEQMINKGAVEIMFTAKESNQVWKILEHYGYEFIARQYSKNLRKE